MGAAALTGDLAFRSVAAGGFLVLVVLIRVVGQCFREWLRLRMVRVLVMAGAEDRIKVVGGRHGCSIDIRPDDSAHWPRLSVDLLAFGRQEDDSQELDAPSVRPKSSRSVFHTEVGYLLDRSFEAYILSL